MSTNVDRSLDEILAEKKPNGRGRGNNGRGNNANGSSNGNRNDNGNNRNGSFNGRRRERRDDFPRDGVRKSYRDEQPRKIDEEWVHDRYDDPPRRGRPDAPNGRLSPDNASAARGGTRVRIENLHYDLTRDDIEGLFQRIGPVLQTDLLYDRAGRSEGIAFVTYDRLEDAREAVREFDRANAKGQQIRLSLVSSRRHPDSGNRVGSGRPLAERISRPGGGNDDDDGNDRKNRLYSAVRQGIDRYVPGDGGGSGGGGGGGGRRNGRLSRSRSPRPRRREGGRRPGERRGNGGGGGGGNGGGGGSGGGGNSGNNGGGRSTRPKKTQEELDAEMEDYFGSGDGHGDGSAAPAEAAPVDDDMDMIG